MSTGHTVGRCTCGPNDACSHCTPRPSFLESLRSAPKDVTPSAQITERENHRIRQQCKRDADPFAKKFNAADALSDSKDSGL